MISHNVQYFVKDTSNIKSNTLQKYFLYICPFGSNDRLLKDYIINKKSTHLSNLLKCKFFHCYSSALVEKPFFSTNFPICVNVWDARFADPLKMYITEPEIFFPFLFSQREPFCHFQSSILPESRVFSSSVRSQVDIPFQTSQIDMFGAKENVFSQKLKLDHKMLPKRFSKYQLQKSLDNLFLL